MPLKRHAPQGALAPLFKPRQGRSGLARFCRLDFTHFLRYSLLKCAAFPAVALSFGVEAQTMKVLMRSLVLCAALLLLWVNPGPVGKAWADEHPGSTLSSHPQAQSGANPGIWLLNVYRDYVSPVDGDRCPSVPTCSSYAVQAFKKHGFFMGWMMTVDRLIHEGREERSVSPLVYSNGTWKLYDPVENNDFWWSHRDRKRDE
jgi:hypothetical protein